MALSADSEYKVSPEDPRIPPNGDTATVGASSNSIKWAIGFVAVMVLVSGAWIGFGDQIAGIFGSSDEDIPVITADPSPIKIKPESPGGMNVPNQGRLVYGMVDGTAAQPRVERLLPAGEKPVEVEEVLTRGVPETNDVVTSAALRGTADVTPSAPVRLVPDGANPAAAPSTPVTAPVAQSAPAPVAPSAPPEVKPAEIVTAPPAPESKSNASAAAPKAPAPKPVAKATPAAATPAATGGDISKSYRVQLAAARSEKAVKSEWDKLQRRNTDLLGKLQLQVTRIDLGTTKGTFYRLRAGPLTSAAEAKALCERLKQRKLGCLVVKPGA